MRLQKLQRTCIEENIPVIIIVDGWESSGKGYIINELVKDLDPKNYRVSVFDENSLTNTYSYSKQSWSFLPAYGDFRILYRSIYARLFNKLDMDKDGRNRKLDYIKNLEKLLTDDHFIIIKYFIDIDKKDLKENIEILKDHHYLWRFYNNFPDRGKMAIFDRSWYGRVMVERVENFANEKEWSRAYEEINMMEKELVDQNVLLIKYNLVISKDEQERRFEDRMKNKPYKITDEDWGNREKWDKYVESMNDMVELTSTSYAPWKLIASENKKHARIEVLKDFINRAEEMLEKNKNL